MKETFRTVYEQIIVDALSNKYPATGEADVRAAFASIWKGVYNESNPESIAEEIQIVQTAYDDIGNQVRLLVLIEKFWSRGSPLSKPLFSLNKFAMGDGGSLSFRKSKSVADYQREIDVSVSEIAPRFDELERVAVAGVISLKDAGVQAQAFLLAFVHGSLIRIHPFADGNGRTARFFIQYALRSWGLPPLPLPKVRNDPEWKEALIAAVDGDCLPLRDELVSRLQCSGIADSK